MLKSFFYYGITFLLLLFIASCTQPTDKKESIVKNLPKDNKHSEMQKFGAWVFSKEDNHCYVYSFPVSSYGFYLERKIHYIQVNDKKEISVLGGLPYKKDSKVRIDIASYSLFLETLNDKAWANNEDFIINYFLKNADSIFFVYNEFTGTDGKDYSAVDKYTMQGFSDAWKYMKDNCKIYPLDQIETNQG